MNKVVIITGASKGIGREIAKKLAIKGYTVVANYNKSENEMKKLKEELNIQGIAIECIKADISKREGAKKIIQYTLEKYKKIDILINNAGISEYKIFTDETDEDWNKIINTNLYSAFVMTQEALASMINNKNGCIINISSIWGCIGASMEVLYSTSKAGINGMTKALAKELGPSNIRVNAIAPGFIETDMTNVLADQVKENILNQIPLKRMGTANEVAKLVKFLSSEDSKYITGQVINVDGGMVM